MLVHFTPNLELGISRDVARETKQNIKKLFLPRAFLPLVNKEWAGRNCARQRRERQSSSIAKNTAYYFSIASKLCNLTVKVTIKH